MHPVFNLFYRLVDDRVVVEPDNERSSVPPKKFRGKRTVCKTVSLEFLYYC